MESLLCARPAAGNVSEQSIRRLHLKPISMLFPRLVFWLRVSAPVSSPAIFPATHLPRWSLSFDVEPVLFCFVLFFAGGGHLACGNLISLTSYQTRAPCSGTVES